jgi:hypothetical protein
MLITTPATDPRLEAELRETQYAPEERDQLYPPKEPFSYKTWQQSAPPATPEELTDWEEFLRERAAEREASLAREAGLTP